MNNASSFYLSQLGRLDSSYCFPLLQAKPADICSVPAVHGAVFLLGDDRMMFPEIDTKQTAVNVQNYFDRTVPRLLSFAGRSIADLTKQEEWERHYQEVPAGSKYEQAVDALIETIGIMRDGEPYHYHRTLLIDCYIKRKTNLDEEIKLGLAERTAIRYRQQACIEFAECFEGVLNRRKMNNGSLLAVQVQ